jgi:hypothetical protein
MYKYKLANLHKRICINYKEHEGLDGKTPAKACGMKIEVQDKWISLIQNANISNRG